MNGIKIAKIAIQLSTDAILATLDEIEKDGYQSKDLLAFISSEKFQENFKLALKEIFNKGAPVPEIEKPE